MTASVPGHVLAPLPLAAGLAEDAQEGATTTDLAVVARASHAALGVVLLSASGQRVATETLAGILGAGHAVARCVAEGDTCLVRHGVAVESGPDWKSTRRNSVAVAAGVGP